MKWPMSDGVSWHGGHYNLDLRALTMVRVKDTIRLRLEKMVDRYEEIGRSLADPAVIGRQREFRELSVEYARLTRSRRSSARFSALERELASAREMQNDSDPGDARHGPRGNGAPRARHRARRRRAEDAADSARSARRQEHLPRSARGHRRRRGCDLRRRPVPHVLALRRDARLHASRCCRRIPASTAAIARSSAASPGSGAFARFKFESGVHRVQRVPATEAQGRIHTSAVHRGHSAGAR